MRVLLVEDEEKVARFVARGLKAECYAVDVAGDGNSGLDHVRACAYDLIVLDLNLPGMPGTELLRHIRKSHPHVPVLILTARDNITRQGEEFRGWRGRLPDQAVFICRAACPSQGAAAARAGDEFHHPARG
jgi:CheY-like chemotaxis protein